VTMSSVDDLKDTKYQSALLEPNRNKNRYNNILPPEYSRVPLIEDDFEEEGDYINANYVSLCMQRKVYIAAQGPLPTTVTDFWRMVYSEKSNIIVMLTRLYESGKAKCFQYWPDESISFGPITITLVSTEESANDIIERRFLITNQTTQEERLVLHYQYTEWPDHGLPASTSVFRSLLQKVDQNRNPDVPIVIHCSAGVGRTGTFCAVHSILHQVADRCAQIRSTLIPGALPEASQREYPLICLPKVILDMRKERTGMVQTRDQYEFCYLALLEEFEDHPELYDPYFGLE